MSTNPRGTEQSDPRGTSTDGSAPVESSDLAQVMGPGLLLLFIVGDILGTGVYALTGRIAGEIGGIKMSRIGWMLDRNSRFILLSSDLSQRA